MIITDEMVEKLCQALDHDISGSQAKIALEVIAPMLIADLREALEAMVAEKADYMIINNLGDPEEQHTIKQARVALARAQELDPK